MATTSSSSAPPKMRVAAKFGAVLAAATPAAANMPREEVKVPFSAAPHAVNAGSTTVTDGYSRAETDAKFEAHAAKAEAARVGIEGKIDLVLAGIAGLKEKLREEVETVKDDNKNTRRVTIVTIVVSVVAAIGAIYAAQANNIAAMQVGLDAASRVAEAPNATGQ